MPNSPEKLPLSSDAKQALNDFADFNASLVDRINHGPGHWKQTPEEVADTVRLFTRDRAERVNPWAVGMQAVASLPTETNYYDFRTAVHKSFSEALSKIYGEGAIDRHEALVKRMADSGMTEVGIVNSINALVKNGKLEGLDELNDVPEIAARAIAIREQVESSKPKASLSELLASSPTKPETKPSSSTEHSSDDDRPTRQQVLQGLADVIGVFKDEKAVTTVDGPADEKAAPDFNVADLIEGPDGLADAGAVDGSNIADADSALAQSGDAAEANPEFTEEQIAQIDAFYELSELTDYDRWIKRELTKEFAWPPTLEDFKKYIASGLIAKDYRVLVENQGYDRAVADKLLADFDDIVSGVYYDVYPLTADSAAEAHDDDLPVGAFDDSELTAGPVQPASEQLLTEEIDPELLAELWDRADETADERIPELDWVDDLSYQDEDSLNNLFSRGKFELLVRDVKSFLETQALAGADIMALTENSDELKSYYAQMHTLVEEFKKENPHLSNEADEYYVNFSEYTLDTAKIFQQLVDEARQSRAAAEQPKPTEAVAFQPIITEVAKVSADKAETHQENVEAMADKVWDELIARKEAIKDQYGKGEHADIRRDQQLFKEYVEDLWRVVNFPDPGLSLDKKRKFFGRLPKAQAAHLVVREVLEQQGMDKVGAVRQADDIFMEAVKAAELAKQATTEEDEE